LTLEDFEFLAAPASLGWQASSLRSPAFLTVRLVLAVFFAGAVFSGRRRLAPGSRPVLALAVVPVICLAIPTGVALLASEMDDWFVVQHGHGVSPTAVALTAPAIALLLLGAVGLLRRGLREQNAIVWVGLGTALIFVAGTCLYSLLMPGLTTDSVSAHEYMRAGAYGLLLVVALRMSVLQSRMVKREVAERERLRLVDDLHDGMAQDLAFIVAQSESLAQELGYEHPMVVAARRALAFSRGAIIDLSAADASTVGRALRSLADELSDRYGLQVRLQIDGDDPGPEERDAVVRIAREAIVNAARHGGARHATVSLDVHGPALMLTVSDDGGGVSGDPARRHRAGYGLRAMRRRAEAIGGQLRTRRGPDGGLAVEVTVS
jgi:signal transduction histidine kinase